MKQSTLKRLRERIQNQRMVGQLEGMLKIMKWAKDWNTDINKKGVIAIIRETIGYLEGK